MTSYVQKKSRVFKEAGEPQPLLPKRSEGRLKRYPSATDARAWTLENEDRRQHILEFLQQKGGGLNLGRYIPLDVLINMLLANKDADIERLRKQLEELQKLLDAYESLELTPEQKRQLQKMKEKLGIAGDHLSASSRRTPTETDGETSASESAGGRARRDGDVSDSTDGCAANAAVAPPPCHSPPATVSGTESGGESDAEGIVYDWNKLTPADMKNLILNKDKELEALKNVLAALQDECDQHRAITNTAVEQLGHLGNVIEERDDLAHKLRTSQQTIETLAVATHIVMLMSYKYLLMYATGPTCRRSE